MFEQWPKLKDFMERMESKEGIQGYVLGDRFIERPFNNKSAKINN